MYYPLIDDFQYIQASIKPDSTLSFEYADQYEKEKQKIINRIIHTETGGCFLLTGYRGVGKTSFIDKVLQEAKNNLDNKKLIPIKINVAKELNENELMHQIIRRCYEELQKENFIDDKIKELLNKAYLRTLFNLRIQSDILKKEILSKFTSAVVKGETGGGVIGVLKAKIGFNIKSTKTSSEENIDKVVNEASYLDYDAKSAETDFINIMKVISKNKRTLPIFVLDELDKLADLSLIEDILKSLKNIFATPGVIFIIIAGIDFFDEVQKDRSSEDSLYQSIFSYHFYLGKDWNIGQKLVGNFSKHNNNDITDEVKLFSNYLEFKSRGIIRNALYTFNRFVEWKKEKAYLRLKDEPQIKYYGSLNEMLKHCLIQEDIIASSITKELTDRIKDSLIDTIYRRIDKLFDGDRFKIEDIENNLMSEQIMDREKKKISNEIIKTLVKDKWIRKIEDNIYILSKEKLELKSLFRKGLEDTYRDRQERKLNSLKRKLEELMNEADNPEEVVPSDDLISTAEKILKIAPDDQKAIDVLSDLQDMDKQAKNILKRYLSQTIAKMDNRHEL